MIAEKDRKLLLTKATAQMQRNVGISNARTAQFATAPVTADVRPNDPILTNLSIGYQNDSLIWDQVSPPLVSDQTGRYFVYTRDFWFRTFEGTGGLVAGENSQYKRVGYGVTNATFNTIHYGAEKLTDRPTIAASQTPENLIDTDVDFVVNLLALNYERLVATTIFKTGVWGTDNTPTNKWDDDTNGTPISDVLTGRQTIRRATGQNPTQMIIGAEGWDSVSEHAELLEKYKYTQPGGGVLGEKLVAEAFKIPDLLVGLSIVNTANEGATFVGADVWGDNALLLLNPKPGMRVPAATFTNVWDEGGQGAIPWAMNQYATENQRANVVQGFYHAVTTVSSTVSGYFFNNVST